MVIPGLTAEMLSTNSGSVSASTLVQLIMIVVVVDCQISSGLRLMAMESLQGTSQPSQPLTKSLMSVPSGWILNGNTMEESCWVTLNIYAQGPGIFFQAETCNLEILYRFNSFLTNCPSFLWPFSAFLFFIGSNRNCFKMFQLFITKSEKIIKPFVKSQ